MDTDFRPMTRGEIKVCFFSIYKVEPINTKHFAEMKLTNSDIKFLLCNIVFCLKNVKPIVYNLCCPYCDIKGKYFVIGYGECKNFLFEMKV